MNVFTFTGYLGADCRTANVSNTSVCNFNVAVKSGYGDKEKTLWLDCALWGKRAESRLVQYLVKGQAVAITGELGTKEHENKTYLTCRVTEIDLIGTKQNNEKSVQQVPPVQTKRAFDDFSDLDDKVPF